MSKINNRIKRELMEILLKPPPGVGAAPKRDHDGLHHWTATIDGPSDSIYENGRFYFDVRFPKDYPFNPPSVRCKTKIYHCNFASNGSICLDILKDNWSPALTISKVLLSIMALLTDPNPEDPLDGDIATIYKTDKKAHDSTAREWTLLYAQQIPFFGYDQSQKIIEKYLEKKNINKNDLNNKIKNKKKSKSSSNVNTNTNDKEKEKEKEKSADNSNSNDKEKTKSNEIEVENDNDNGDEINNDSKEIEMGD